MKLTFRVTGSFATLMLKRPSKSVMTPWVVPSTMTLAENIGSPVSPSFTKPTNEVWAQENAVNPKKRTSTIPFRRAAIVDLEASEEGTTLCM